jgi:glutathione S-transferase
MSFPLQALKATQSLSAYPSIAAFVDRVESDPAWKRVVERAGPLTMPGE